MKTVPLATGVGHIPLRTSKNPVLGVFRHHCGAISSVHQPRGNRRNTRYLICDNCGTDQAAGQPYQEKIRNNTFDSIEELEAAELANNHALAEEKAAQAVAIAPVVEQEKAVVEPVVEPVVEQEKAVVEPEVKVVPEPVKTMAEPKNEVERLQVGEPESEKAKRVGLAAVFGGLFGGLLAVVL